jgi:formylglycine-generating enzyme required for sulfatase activity
MIRISAGESIVPVIKVNNSTGEFIIQRVKVHNNEIFMAKTPFTNRQFSRLLALEPEKLSLAVKKPEKLLEMSESVATFKNEVKDCPLVYASREEAEGIMAILRMKPPTWLQWVRMASYIDGRLFPWGTWPEMKPNYAVYNCGGTRKVKEHSFCTPEGFTDVAGNVLERTSTFFGDIDLSDPRKPKFPKSGSRRFLCGGAFTAKQPRYLMNTYLIPDTVPAMGRSCDKNVGFRPCVGSDLDSDFDLDSLLMRLALGIINPRS